jgi:hypothetical protein
MRRPSNISTFLTVHFLYILVVSSFQRHYEQQGKAHVEELAEWLKSQHKGLRTYKTFQQKVLEVGAKHRDHYALCYLLAMLAGRFSDTYEETPLTLDVTDEAHRRLVAYADKAAKFDSIASDSRLEFLNEIAASDLH